MSTRPVSVVSEVLTSLTNGVGYMLISSMVIVKVLSMKALCLPTLPSLCMLRPVTLLKTMCPISYSAHVVLTISASFVSIVNYGPVRNVVRTITNLLMKLSALGRLEPVTVNSINSVVN